MGVDGRPAGTLGAPHDRPREVEIGRRLSAAGEDEGTQRRQVGTELVAGGLEFVDPLLLDAQGRVRGLRHEGCRQVGADVEQVVLDAQEHWAQPLRQIGGTREREAERGAGLVRVGVGDEARVVLRRPAEVAEARAPVVTGAGVDRAENHHAPTVSRTPDGRRSDRDHFVTPCGERSPGAVRLYQ